MGSGIGKDCGDHGQNSNKQSNVSLSISLAASRLAICTAIAICQFAICLYKADAAPSRDQNTRSDGAYAVVIGNNVGRFDESTLAFAERDAQRVAQTLRAAAGVSPDNLVVALGSDASGVREAIINTNRKIRARSQPPELLVVYYSGHGDARSLHLGDGDLSFSELEGLVAGSSARLRVLIVDACRTGPATTLKGGYPAPPILIEAPKTESEGMVVLMASAAGEDAQESPALGGSFFTHHFVSGLLGAADADRDNAVTVEEAYKYAYVNTLRDSSATIAGTQHPSYRYAVEGQGKIILTRIRTTASQARLEYPEGLDVLVMGGSRGGPVIAEGRASDGKSGVLSLPPARYFVRARAPAALLEQEIDLRPSETHRLDPESMERIEFARLARKGGTHQPFVAGLGLSGSARRSVSNTSGLCLGSALRGILLYRNLSLATRLSVCREAQRALGRAASTTEAQLAFAVSMHHDFTATVSGYIGPEIAWSLMRQGFASASLEDPRNAVAGALTLQGGMDWIISRRIVINVGLLAQTYFVNLEDSSTGDSALSTAFSWGAVAGLTRYFNL